MGKFIDLTGQRFGKLVVKERADNYKYYSKSHGRVLQYAQFLCECDCGGNSIYMAQDLKKGKVGSCGCILEESGNFKFKHGKSYDQLYYIFTSMIERCYSPSCKSYQNYGGRGITVCDRWLKGGVMTFIEDMGERPKGYSVERLDNDKGYSPENCLWKSNRVQANNKRGTTLVTYQDITLSMSEWAHLLNLPYSALKGRLNRKWTPEEALNTPQKHHKMKKRHTTKSETMESVINFLVTGQGKNDDFSLEIREKYLNNNNKETK